MEPKEETIQSEFRKIYTLFLNHYSFKPFHPISALGLFVVVFGLILLGIIVYPIDYELTLFCFLQGCFGLLGYYYLRQGVKRSALTGILDDSPSHRQGSASSHLYSRVLKFSFWFFSIGYIFVRILSLSHLPSNFHLETEEIILFWYAILVSISEELFFRGFLICTFLNLRSTKVPKDFEFDQASNSSNNGIKFTELLLVVILQAAIWTLLHVNYYGDLALLVPIFISGTLFGFLYVYRKDIRIPIVLHMFGNLIANFEMFF